MYYAAVATAALCTVGSTATNRHSDVAALLALPSEGTVLFEPKDGSAATNS
jgi:hypothetical protein